MNALESAALNWTFVIPVVGLVLFLWGFARRIQPLLWLGLAVLLVVPALSVVDRVLNG
jgi:hypothetical protein